MSYRIEKFAPSASCVALVLALLVTGTPALAGGGPLGIDARVDYDNRGIWARNDQLIMLDSLIGIVGAGALWEGGEDRLGKTLWQSVDSGVISAVAAQGMKFAFSRERPSQTPDPNKWFTGHGQSFPSGEVTTASALVTPFVLEYGRDHPAIYALELFPVYDAIARVKVWGHWQSDVIAGFALGTASGYFLHRDASPLIFSVMPHGIQIGIKKQF